MKRISIVALAAGAMTLALAACGQDGSTTTTGQNTNTAATTTRLTAPRPSTTAAAPIEPPSEAPVSPVTKKTTAPNGAQTTCGEFRDLDDATEKSVIDQILAANPGSILEGSPNVALGTAKLACLADAYTQTPVAVAIRVAPK
ncbi:hypothetical protein [Nocardia crassostreae]|uniref:hypothetical protein n=1 Tax=Nocardia crassostreae TaxID=53428 RepID=UPI0008376F05|nr:hypothetical protein [Nocardia crassostreae]